MIRTLGFAACIAALMPHLALAQPAQTIRVRGAVESIEGKVLVVKARNGATVQVRLADNWTVIAYTRAQLSDIRPGSYVGVAGTPQADGSQKAISVNIFPESARGLGEGFRPYDLPNSTMTNAAVADAVESVDGQTLRVKYKDGEKTILIAPSTPIATFGPGDVSELKSGASVALTATKKDDSVLEASRIGVGRDGFVPN
jgi:hypothetical protein